MAFTGQSMILEDVVDLVLARIGTWVSCMSKFDNLKVDSILFNWGASLLSGAHKAKNSVS